MKTSPRVVTLVTPLSPEDQKLCDGPIADAECLSAAKDFKKCKTPGTDGFPAEFYQFFWPELRTEMLASFHGKISVQVPTSLCMLNKLIIHSRYCFVEQYVYPREPNIYMGNLYLRDE